MKYEPNLCMHVGRTLKFPPHMDWREVRVGDSLEFWPKQDGLTVIGRYWRRENKIGAIPTVYISLCDKPGYHR